MYPKRNEVSGNVRDDPKYDIGIEQHPKRRIPEVLQQVAELLESFS
jgi:hypothetical protein